VVHPVQRPFHSQLNERLLASHPLESQDGASGHLHRIVPFHHTHHTRHFPVELGFQHRRTPRHHHPNPRVFPLDPPDVPTGVGIGLVRDGAGIHDAKLGLPGTRGGLGPERFQLLPHSLGVVLVGFTPEGPEQDAERLLPHYADRLLGKLSPNAGPTSPIP